VDRLRPRGGPRRSRDTELGRVVLVDLDADALEEAGRDLRAREVERVQADLSADEGLLKVREALGEARDGAITCFETVEHLAAWPPLVELLIELAEQRGFTVVLSVPNDAFWALANPFHQTMWGDGAFEELRRLLPADAVVATQVPLSGSAIVCEPLGGAPTPIPLPSVVPGPGNVPSHHLVAFGPQAQRLAMHALATPTDLDGQRRWEREREAQLAHHEAELADLREHMRAASDELARLNAQHSS